MGTEYENIADVGEGRAVGDDARESDLRIAVVGAETDRVLDRPLDQIARDIFRPVRFLAEIAMDHRDVEPRLIGTDRVHGASMQQIVDENLLKRAHDHAVDFLRTLPSRHVGARATRDELLAMFRAPLSDAGEDARSVLDLLASGGDRGVVGSAGPRYY